MIDEAKVPSELTQYNQFSVNGGYVSVNGEIIKLI